MSPMCFLFSLNHIRPLGKSAPFFRQGALIQPWGMPSFRGAPRPPLWKPVGRAPCLLAGEHGQAACVRCHSGAAAGWPATGFESSPTLARACRTTTTITTQTPAQRPCARHCVNSFCPPKYPRRQPCGSSHVIGEEPDIRRGSEICPGLFGTLNLCPILPLWVGWEGQLGLVMTSLGCVCTGPGWES